MTACVLVDRAVPLARIVGCRSSWPAALEPIQEFQTAIAKCTGARLFIDAGELFDMPLEQPQCTATVIRFNIIPADQHGLGKDGFRIRVTDRSVDFDAEQQAGLFNAVYSFLSRHCGFEWLWPGRDGEVYDRTETLAVPVGQFEERPQYLWRWLADTDAVSGGASELIHNKWNATEFHMFPPQHATDEFHLWCRRNRLGGLKIKAAHAWGELIDPDVYGDDHLEYFAEVNSQRRESIANWDGKHGGQLCTSNPDVIDLFVVKLRKFFDENPQYDAASISPNDGLGFCECDSCIALDVKFGNAPPDDAANGKDDLEGTFKDDADRTGASSRITGPITDRMFTFANAIAEKIAESHPDKLLLMLVYSCYRTPPRKVRLAPNIIAQYCVQCHQHWDPQARDADMREVKALADNASQIGIYEYYDQGAWPGVIRSFADLISQSLRRLTDLGVRYYSPQASGGFAVNGFNLWFLAAALWDVSYDVDVGLDRYCSKAFGQAAESMKTYFNLWRGRWKECKGLTQFGDVAPGSGGSVVPLTPFDQLRRLYPAEFLEKCSAEIDNARKTIADGSVQRRRVEFIARGLEATNLAVDAANVSYALAEQGWPMQERDVTAEVVASLGSPDDVRSRADHALGYWDRWEGYLESLRDDFVLSHFWARYSYDSRKGLHPHCALRRILSILDDNDQVKINC